MPIHIFTEAERATLDTFLAEITHEDLITFFTLSEADQAQLPIDSAPYNRLGFALQLCTLAFYGLRTREAEAYPTGHRGKPRPERNAIWRPFGKRSAAPPMKPCAIYERIAPATLQQAVTT
jgi:hypothetical protein